MTLLPRTISPQVRERLGRPGTTLVLYGASQTGRTTLVNRLLTEMPGAVAFVGDDLYAQSLLSRRELEHLRRVVGGAATVFIDEARRIENIGLTLKLLVDHLPVTVIASGSSSFALAARLSEPLTGRAHTFHLYPLSWEEVAATYRATAPETALEEMPRFGMYPRVHMLESNGEKEEYPYDYLSSYLYRDLLAFEAIKKPRKVVDLLLLAHRIGKEVAVSELAKSLSLSQRTVESYLDVLEKMFVGVNVRGFSRNLRKEVTRTSRYYFVDVGLRNALIRSFVPLSLRGDAGGLFESWFVTVPASPGPGVAAQAGAGAGPSQHPGVGATWAPSRCASAAASCSCLRRELGALPSVMQAHVQEGFGRHDHPLPSGCALSLRIDERREGGHGAPPAPQPREPREPREPPRRGSTVREDKEFRRILIFPPATEPRNGRARPDS